MSLDNSTVKELEHRAAKIRLLSLKTTAKAGSGHPTSCCSCADILATLFFNTMRYDPQTPGNSSNDRLVLSKGHAAPALYAAWSEAGYLKEEELFDLREMGSRIEGHPMPSLDFVDVATGSLGQGLSAGLGIAIHQKKVVKNNSRTFVLMGDGEMAEGAVWEAFALASDLQIDNLVAIIDVNRLGQSRETMYGHDTRSYARKVEAFGWEAIVVEDGHNVADLAKAFDRAVNVTGKPVCVVAKTFKGGGLPEISDQDNWHGKPIMPGKGLEQSIEAIEPKLMKSPPTASIPKPEPAKISEDKVTAFESNAQFDNSTNRATREAVGEALIALGKQSEKIWVVDGDTGNSTFAQKFEDVFPERFIECFIAEQNMVGVSSGLASRGLIPFAVTFGAFLARAYDQIRMSAVSGLGVKLIGTHAGISIGEDGASQMALEDLAAFSALPDCTVFYPSDIVSAYKCIIEMAKTKGPAYIRLSRPKSPVLYDNQENFAPGELKVIKQSNTPALTIATSGVILHEVLKAVKDSEYAQKIQVVDLYCLKPFPAKQLSELVIKSNGNLAIFEEHSYQGGIGSAAAMNLAGHIKRFTHKAVDSVPCSGSPEKLLESYELDSKSIGKIIKEII